MKSGGLMKMKRMGGAKACRDAEILTAPGCALQ
jgi:hypothetical protein